MSKIVLFNFITLNGYFHGTNNDLSWHKHGGEESKYSEEMLKEDNILLFGRVTYEMMASYWPTPMAMQNDPLVAKGMNEAEKIVFSRTLKTASWEHTRIISKDIIDEIKVLKNNGKKDMAILGSGSIATQFANKGLIDEYQLMIDPVALGDGASFLKGLEKQLDLKHKSTKTFKSGVVLLTYSS